MQNHSKPSILILSMATQGYKHLYHSNLSSHQRYADKHGYRYLCITKPHINRLGGEIVWLKLYALLTALEAGYQWVMFVDADAYIQADTPLLESLEDNEHCIFMALGYSGRVNSGVMIFQNKAASKTFLKQIIARREQPLNAKDDVGWGENGHVIQQSRNEPYLRIIDQRWNNNVNPELNDYIRHYSAGPLRQFHQVGFIKYWHYRIESLSMRVLTRLLRNIWAVDACVELNALSKAINVYYPSLTRTP